MFLPIVLEVESKLMMWPQPIFSHHQSHSTPAIVNNIYFQILPTCSCLQISAQLVPLPGTLPHPLLTHSLVPIPCIIKPLHLSFGSLSRLFKFIYLAALGLSCGNQDRQSSLRHVGSFFLSCSMWELVPWPGIEPGPCTLGSWSLSHWTTREVPFRSL